MRDENYLAVQSWDLQTVPSHAKLDYEVVKILSAYLSSLIPHLSSFYLATRSRKYWP